MPAGWVAPVQVVALTNLPTTDGKRVNLRISGGSKSVTLSLTAPGPSVEFQLPIFVNNIASASAGTIVEASGTVRLPAGQTSVTVRLVSE